LELKNFCFVIWIFFSSPFSSGLRISTCLRIRLKITIFLSIESTIENHISSAWVSSGKTCCCSRLTMYVHLQMHFILRRRSRSFFSSYSLQGTQDLYVIRILSLNKFCICTHFIVRWYKGRLAACLLAYFIQLTWLNNIYHPRACEYSCSNVQWEK
jgi:hypothetical protein